MKRIKGVVYWEQLIGLLLCVLGLFFSYLSFVVFSIGGGIIGYIVTIICLAMSIFFIALGWVGLNNKDA